MAAGRPYPNAPSRQVGLWIAVAPLIFTGGLIALELSRSAWLSVLSMPVIGFGMLVQTASGKTILQTLVVDGMRGRVMG